MKLRVDVSEVEEKRGCCMSPLHECTDTAADRRRSEKY